MEFSQAAKKTENFAALLFSGVIILIPVLFKIIRDVVRIPFAGSDTFLIYMVFVFACIAGMVTTREKKQLAITTFFDMIPDKISRWISPVVTFSSSAVLISLFFSCLSQIFIEISMGMVNKVWGIPLFVFTAFLPLMYLVMWLRQFNRNWVSILACVLGLIAGVVISCESIYNILYDFLPETAEKFNSFANIYWFKAAYNCKIPGIIFLVILALLGMPLFLVISGIAYLCFSSGGGYVQVLAQESVSALTDKTVAAIPLFTMAGYILASGSAGKRLVNVVQSAFGWLRGGAAIAAVVVAAFFTTFTGASGVTILALGSLLSIILEGNGYSKDDSLGLITSSGSIGLLFPPSMAVIVYATTNYFPMSYAGVDVYDLFKGAVIPGILLCLGMIVLGVIRDKNPVRKKFSSSQLFSSLKESLWELLLPVLIIVFYFAGILSLTETACVAVIYSAILITLIRKEKKLTEVVEILVKSIPVAGGVLMIISSARGLLYYFIDAGIPDMMTGFVTSIVHSKLIFLALLNIFLLVVGCLMDMYSAILVVSPLIIPVAESFGINQIHIAVVFLTNMALGFLTPPVGMNLFIASYTFDKPLLKICRSVLPYLALQFVVLLLVTYVPWFSTAFL